MKLTPLEPWILQKINASHSGLSRANLESYQLEQLRRTIRLGREKSRFYARRLANAPGEISRLEDLAVFPFTTAEDLRRDGPQFLCVSQGEIERVVTLDTSGTTGRPKRLYFTRQDQELTIDFFQYGMSTLVQAGQNVLILLPGEKPGSVGDLLFQGLQRLGARPVPHGPVKDPRKTLEIMRSQKIDSLVGAPTHLLSLAHFWETGNHRRVPPPRSILLSTDHVPQAIVEIFAEKWGCQVYNHYGMTEMGLGGGVECDARRGYHLREADLYFEIVHPKTGQPATSGEMGEVVFTTLTRQGMPLIRYRTGDLSRFIPGQCPCGTVLHSLEKITRRISSAITLKVPAGTKASFSAGGPELYMADLDEALFPIPQLVNFSAALVSREGDAAIAKERLEIEVIIMPEAAGNIAHQVLQALDTIPAIQLARQVKALDIWIRVNEFDPDRAGSLAKRVLVDKRGKNHV
jgi:phenylacetate-CoA ligase